MKIMSLKKAENMRKERNSDVIRRMRNGDQLSSFNSYSSWFPPRPVIEKDAGAVRRLYGGEPLAADKVSQVGDEHRNPGVEDRSKHLRLA